MPLGREVNLGPDHIVLNAEPAPPAPSKKGAQQPPLFGPCLLWPNSRLSQLLLSTCCIAHDRDRQSDRQTDHATPSVAIGLSR